MDEAALQKAKNLLEISILANPNTSAALHMILAEVLDDLGKPDLQQNIRLLEKSVQLEPDWVNNHLRLAWSY